ncbi:ABC transporter substrate-binding protein [Glaciibacter sp. 2TAF33]|uniref:ABC transporter substrate-binding protein n=1 Tax=Glaciibacter sp. 2TAF33 TaxID=3233015 RepID=UPI003F90E80A
MAFGRRITYLAMMAAVAMGLVACTGGAPSPGVTDKANADVTTGQFGGQQLAIGKPVEGGELTWGIWLPIQTLEPAGVMGDSMVLAMKSIFGSLMSATADGGVKPNLAKSLKTQDNVVWTMALDPDVKFTDGTPLNAAAVITHLTNVAAEGSTSTQAGDARKIAGMTAVDDFTVKFTLAAPNNQFGLLFTENSMGFIPSPTAKEAAGADFATKPVGAGPFKVESFTPGAKVVLVKNPDYKFASEGLPYLDKVTLTTVQEENSRIDGVRAGNLDGATVASVPAVEKARAAGLVGLEQPAYSAFYMILNNQNEVLSDIRVRTALNEAIDRKAVNQVVYEGLHQPMDGILVPSHPYAGKGAKWPSENVKDAKKLIDEYLADTGKSKLDLTVTIVPGGDNAQVAPLVQQMLGAIGVTVNIETQDQTALVGKFAGGDFDIALITRAFQPETTTALSQAFRTGSTRNWSKVSIPELDALFDKSAAALSDADRLAVVPKILDVLAKNVVTVPIVSAGSGRVLGPKVKGFPDGDPTTRTIEVFDLSSVWVAK